MTVPEDDRDKLRRRLLENGIESMVYYSEALHTPAGIQRRMLVRQRDAECRKTSGFRALSAHIR
ncbi:MAG: hypothetical protein ACLR8Y_04520 [Alistipes indistinctus]